MSRLVGVCYRITRILTHSLTGSTLPPRRPPPAARETAARGPPLLYKILVNSAIQCVMSTLYVHTHISQAIRAGTTGHPHLPTLLVNIMHSYTLELPRSSS